MALKRSTGGLLQSEQRTVLREDFQNVVRVLTTHLRDDPELARRLGLEFAKRYAEAPVTPSRAPVKARIPIEDLQREPRTR